MAGPKFVDGKTVADGTRTGGFPTVTVVVNGNTEKGDEWALFRLTDEGLGWWLEGPDFRASIMSLQLKSGPAVVELFPRHKTRKLAEDAWGKLIEDERDRTLIRSVKPAK